MVKTSIGGGKNLEYDEALLIQELKQGSIMAFNAIYDLYSRRLLAFCIKFTKDSHDAEDIVHSTFLRLWRIREKIRQEETLKSLLFIIAKGYLIKHYNKEKKHRYHDRIEDFVDSAKSEEITENKAEYVSLLKHFTNEIQLLPETQKKVVTKAKIEGMSSKEIAELYGLSEQTVRNQLSLAMKKIRTKIESVSGKNKDE